MAHKLPFTLGKLALALCDGGEAILSLPSKYARGTGAFACSAALAALYLYGCGCTEKLGIDIGDEIADKDIAAVFFVNNKTVITGNTEAADKRRVALVNRAVVAVALYASGGIFRLYYFFKRNIYLGYGYMVIKRGGIAR